MSGAACLGISGQALGSAPGRWQTSARTAPPSGRRQLPKSVRQLSSTSAITSNSPHSRSATSSGCAACRAVTGRGTRPNPAFPIRSPAPLPRAAASQFTTARTDLAWPSIGAPLVAWLDCGSYEATKAYIDKEIVAAAAGGLCSDGITISGSAAGVGGSTWVLDDTAHGGYVSPGHGAFDSYVPMLTGEGVSPGNIDLQANQYGPVVSAATNVTAYCSWGVHSGELRAGQRGDADAWPCNGDQGTAQVQFNFTNQLGIGWWVGTSVESFNGMYGETMGDPTEFCAHRVRWNHAHRDGQRSGAPTTPAPRSASLARQMNRTYSVRTGASTLTAGPEAGPRWRPRGPAVEIRTLANATFWQLPTSASIRELIVGRGIIGGNELR